MSEPCSIRVNGVERRIESGVSVAAALGNCGVDATHRSVSGEWRAPLCGMGICYECRARVDGVPDQRTCMSSVHAGLQVDAESNEAGESIPRPAGATKLEADVLVIGAGPAGLAAAASSAEHGRRVTLLDDNAGLGGQIWRKDESRSSKLWRDRVSRSGVQTIHGASVVGSLEDGRLFAAGQESTFVIHAANVVLATGATELFLPFPGWTLPGVAGVGGLQAMVKGGLDVRGKRIVIAGSGPLLLAVAAFVHARGGEVRVIAEQAPLVNVRSMAGALLRRPRKLIQGARLKATLLDIDQRFGWWPVVAEGTDRVAAAVLTDGAQRERIDCEYLAIGFGLVPNTRIAALFGCQVESGRVIVDDQQQTSVPGIFAVGECTGVGGVDKALAEGRIAGLVCAGRGQETRAWMSARDREREFVDVLARSFALRPELRDIVTPETLVCRCEDVRWDRIAAASSWREAKLQSRCGMGPCQGRICGPAVQWLTGWRVEDVRPPVFNVPLGALAAMESAAKPAESDR